MAIPISELRRSRASGPVRGLIYAEGGLGKTSLGAEFPDAIFLQTEEGNNNSSEILSWGQLNTYGELMDQIVELQEADHDLKTVVVDSATPLERMIWEETCLRGDDTGKDKINIEDFGFGKGFKSFAPRVWNEFLTELYKLRTLRGMNILMIAHQHIRKFDDPLTSSYDRYEIAINETAREMIVAEMDMVLFLNSPVSIVEKKGEFGSKHLIGAGTGKNVVMNTVKSAAFYAKNRYGMPEKIPYILGKGYEALAPYFPKPAAAEPEPQETMEQKPKARVATQPPKE